MKDFDLWGKIDLSNENENDPFEILNKQANIFEKKVKNVLFARLVKQNISSGMSKYNLAINFQIVCPTLDNYSYTLFTVYSKIEKDYPLTIEVNFSRISKGNALQVEYQCNNEEEFIKVLSIILQSEDAKKVVKRLYHKSKL